MAYTTQNMGLTVWNSLDDFFSHLALETNWVMVDQHNHTNGEGQQIPSAGLVNGAITTAKIANGAVTSAKIDPSLLNSFLPSGIMLDFAGSAAPSGFLLCDGTAYQQSAYPALSSAIGTTYNLGGESAGYFRVPDSRGLVHVGATNGGSGAPALASTLSTRIPGPRGSGIAGGEEQHTLGVGELAVHTHTISTSTTGAQVQSPAGGHQHGFGYYWNQGQFFTITYQGGTQGAPGTSTTQIPDSSSFFQTTSTNAADTGDYLSDPGHTHTLGNAGSGSAHNNMQPFLVVTKIIKY